MCKIYICMVFVFCVLALFPQEAGQDNSRTKGTEKLLFSGQLSAWGQLSPDIPTKIRLGGRYIPQLNFGIPLKEGRLFDIEASANLSGDMGAGSGKTSAGGKLKPYRAWARYSSARSEVRIGLQKINFGPAQMFRPLMWFDGMDPRDPLQLTDGVRGGLFRYYSPNNATLWLWSLYGNKGRKGWELLPSSGSFPGLGGRIQLPVPKGEAALSYHFRKADAKSPGLDEIPENRLGFDLRLDVTVGLWLESSWTRLNGDVGELTNQQMLTLGTDYTFDIGNGLAATFEQFFHSHARKGIDAGNSLNFSGLHISYPLTLLDNLSSISYYDWKEHHFYNFINWQHQLNNISFHVIAYRNPAGPGIPSQTGTSARFAGKGFQLMVVWHH